MDTDKKRVPHTVVMKCPTCKDHTFQDTVYGKNMRVCNLSSKGARCTVCTCTHTVSAELLAAVKPKKGSKGK